MIYDKLYSWQKKVIDNFKDRQSFGLFIDMGLGKTPMSLAFAEANNCTKIIIVTINSKALESKTVSGSWFNWCQSISPGILSYYTKLTKRFEIDSSVLLINYESLFSRKQDRKSKVTLKENIVGYINSCKNQNVAIIVDESHKMKNLQSMQTNAIFKIKRELVLRGCNVFTYLLSGTPFTTSYVDLYAQLKMLGWEETKNTFLEKFCIKGNLPGLLGWQQPIVGYKNLDELFKLIHRFGITMKSEDVVSLPEKIFVEHVDECSNDFYLFSNERIPAKEIYKECKKRKIEFVDNGEHKVNNPFCRNIDYPNSTWVADTTGSLWMRARQLSIGFQGNAEEAKWFDRTRLNSLETFLETNRDNYVLFYNYTPELLELYELCEKLNYNIDVYCGEIKNLTHYEAFSKLNESDKLTTKGNIILANFVSGSTGMNWQEYNKCIIFSLPLYKDYEQGIKRIHRLGQTKTTIYHIFYQNNWLDNSMLKSLNECQDYSVKMFESDLKRVQNIMEE